MKQQQFCFRRHKVVEGISVSSAAAAAAAAAATAVMLLSFPQLSYQAMPIINVLLSLKTTKADLLALSYVHAALQSKAAITKQMLLLETMDNLLCYVRVA